MTKEEIRLACLDLALQGNQQREMPQRRAATFEEFVGDDPIRLGCVKLAVKSHGGLARVGSERIVEEAQTYLRFVSPPPARPAAKKRGRPRRTDSPSR